MTVRTPALGVDHLASGRTPDLVPGKNRVHLDLTTGDRPAEAVPRAISSVAEE